MLNHFVNMLKELNWGSVPDWIGNVTIPAILAWFTFKYRSQENQTRKQKEKNTVAGLIFNLDSINKHLGYAEMAGNAKTFQDELNKHLDSLKRIRDTLEKNNDNDNAQSAYSTLNDIIDRSKEKTMNINWIKSYYFPMFIEVNDDLRKYYKQLG